MKYKLNSYGEKIVKKFLDKCKADGSYKRVYEDFEDGTYLLEDTIENLYDTCAWLYLTYGEYGEWIFDTLDEWKKDDDSYAWKYWADKNKESLIELSFEEVETELHKMFDRI